jgi:hypothetical protein
VSRHFYKKNSARISPGFRAFRRIVKVHQQAISTGGKFIAFRVENLPHEIFNRRDTKARRKHQALVSAASPRPRG